MILKNKKVIVSLVFLLLFTLSFTSFSEATDQIEEEDSPWYASYLSFLQETISFLKDIKSKLTLGWNGFDGYVVVQKQATPRGIPFEYVMQPCDVKLNYKGTPWFTVKMEISHNEIGNADEIEMISPSETIIKLFDFLCFC